MIRVDFFQCNALQENCYVAWDEASHEAVIIDPGFATEWEWQRAANYLASNQLTLKAVLLTHNHVDQCMGSAYPARACNVEVCGSKEDQDHLPSAGTQAIAFGLGVEPNCLPISHDLREGDVLHLGQYRIEVIDCPGHSHHGLCYYLPEAGVLFSGDVLFYCSVGRSDFGPAMGGNGPLLVQGIVQKLLTLPAEVKVYPGHGPQTTIGTEATYNPYV